MAWKLVESDDPTIQRILLSISKQPKTVRQKSTCRIGDVFPYVNGKEQFGQLFDELSWVANKIWNKSHELSKQNQ
jgi:hypothetical protein